MFLSETVVSSLKEFITELSGFEDGSEPFNHILKHFIFVLKKSDTMYFPSKPEIDKQIKGMEEKFCFHGFFPQAEALRSCYKSFLTDNLPKSEIMNRLNMVKFLMYMSQCPTKHFLENPDMVLKQRIEPEKEVDWGAFLKEGMDKFKGNYYDFSDDDSYSSIDEEDGTTSVVASNLTQPMLPIQIKSSDKICLMDLKTNREELLGTVQHTWYNQDQFFMEPASECFEANVGILWENHLKDQVQGMILLKSPSVITEYKTIREILWQMWSLHTSSTFELRGNSIKPRPDVTLASVRSYAFYTCMEEFTMYMELLDYFRRFEGSLEDFNVCHTYQSYCKCLKTIVRPVYKQLADLEDDVRKQERTYTLLSLAKDLKIIMRPLLILREFQESLVLNLSQYSPLRCATVLLTKLHESLGVAINKEEQDLKLTLFLESLFYYLSLVDSWLMKGDFKDYTGEFVIEQVVSNDGAHTEFKVRENIETKCKSNPFLTIFMEKVLKMGRNINFLRLLKKYDIIWDCRASIYEEFIDNMLEKIAKYNNTNITNHHLDNIISKEEMSSTDIIMKTNFVFPALGPAVRNAEFQKVENLVDIDDGFLVTAFADFLTHKPALNKDNSKDTLYKRISKNTPTLFLKQDFCEEVLVNIIEKRFTVSGLMVKNLLIEEHLLEKQFQFLKHLYLFFDDLIFPFYKRLFDKSDSSANKNWANDIWLTSHIHDIFMDLYPQFYEKCSVKVKSGTLLLNDDLVPAWSLIQIDYEMRWPLNIIIKQEQMNCYKRIFQFLLKLKWALHTLNRLVFSDLERSKSLTKKSQRTFKATNHQNKPTAKLIRLKFYLTNVINSLQHFVFGFIFGKNLAKFELDFEKAYDLNTLIGCHYEFIKNVEESIRDLRVKMFDKDKNNVLYCIKLLKQMWNGQKSATADRISECIRIYKTFYSDISPIIFPVHIYDY
ncbi:gamma-tubulin complex component 5-like [Anthonomus grandis grandis]|uniref:gamma-tubulin complex component 5-like n=1 Tax=Anthonomus grandis grandis TaxID=2921223 RepID=UPI0021652EF2|nr:gamma-tubulin complex component 5-like [Anthonomus grandis grandis]